MDLQQARQLAADLLQAGDHQGAATVLHDAARQARSTGDLDTASLLLAYEGQAWWNAGDVQQAWTALRERLEVTRELGGARELAQTLIRLWMFPLGDRDDKTSYFREARELVSTHGFSDLAAEIESNLNLFRSAGIPLE